MTAYITSVSGQSMYDLCLMAYKTLDQMAKFCTDNSVNDLNYVPVLPQTFVYDTNLTTDQKTNNYVYATAYIPPAGGVSPGYILVESGGHLLTEGGSKLLVEI